MWGRYGYVVVEGAVPGSKGGIVLIRDAVKKALPEGVPMPGAFKKRGDDSAPAPVPAETGAE